MFYSRSWMMFHYILSKKNSCFINDFYEIFKIFQDLSWSFKIFQDLSRVLLKILNDFLLYVFYSLSIHVVSMILMIFSRFFRIFQDFSCSFKMLSDILLHIFKNNIQVLLLILIKFSKIFKIFQDFSWIFKIFHDFSWFFSTFYFCSPCNHD